MNWDVFLSANVDKKKPRTSLREEVGEREVEVEGEITTAKVYRSQPSKTQMVGIKKSRKRKTMKDIKHPVVL